MGLDDDIWLVMPWGSSCWTSALLCGPAEEVGGWKWIPPSASSPIHHPSLAPPWPLISGTPLQSNMSFSVTRSLSLLDVNGPHHLPASPQSVLLKVPPWHLPPSVSPWIASLMVISWVTMGVVYVVVVFACLPLFGFTCGYY